MNKHFDLTQGSIFRKLLIVALPIMGTQLMQMAYNLTDMFWLGRLSKDSVAASGTAGLYIWLSMGFILLGRMGAEIGVSQSLGKNDRNLAQKFGQNGIFISAVLGIMYCIALVLFNVPLINVLNVKEAVVAADSSSYLAIVALGMPSVFISVAINGSFTGSGNSRLPFLVNSVGLVINMILDPLMIIHLGWGIKGAAFATIIAQNVVGILFILAIKFNKKRPFEKFVFFVKPEIDKIKQILKWSIPIGLESLLFTLLAMTTTPLLNSYGSGAMAVQRVGSQIESLSWLIGGGFGSAVTAFIGQNYGSEKFSRIRSCFKIGTVTMIMYACGIILVLVFAGETIFSLFLPDVELKNLGGMYLKIISTCQLFACLEYISGGILRGSGRTLPPSIISIISNILRVPICYGLASTSLGLYGIWWGMSICCIIRGVTMFICVILHNRRLPKNDSILTKT